MEEANISTLVLNYRRIRSKLESMKIAYEESCKPYKAAQELVEAEIKRILDEVKADSVRTEYGTAYKSLLTTVKMDDTKAYLTFVLRQVPQLDDAFVDHIATLLQVAASVRPDKTFVEDYISDNDHLPEGVAVARFFKINVRK